MERERQVGLCRRDAHSRAAPCDKLEPAPTVIRRICRAASFVCVARDRNPGRGHSLVVESHEAFGCNTDDRTDGLADAQCLPEHARIAAVACAPEAITEDNDRRSDRQAVVGRVKKSSMYRPGVEKRKVV